MTLGRMRADQMSKGTISPPNDFLNFSANCWRFSNYKIFKIISVRRFLWLDIFSKKFLPNRQDLSKSLSNVRGL